MFNGVGLKQLTYLDSKHNIGWDYIIDEKSKNYNACTSLDARVYKRVNYDSLSLGQSITVCGITLYTERVSTTIRVHILLCGTTFKGLASDRISFIP